MMDEPSCGLDPASRENLWNIIQGIIKSGTSILLTSHSMEEATALCQRVGIMVKGKLKDCGTQVNYDRTSDHLHDRRHRKSDRDRSFY